MTEKQSQGRDGSTWAAERGWGRLGRGPWRKPTPFSHGQRVFYRRSNAPPHTHTPHIPPFSVSVLILRDVLLRCHPPSTLKGKGGAKWLMGWEGRRGRGWLRRLYPPWRGRPWSPRRPIGAPWFLRAAPRAYPEEREGGKGSAPLVEVGDARDGRSFVLDSFFLSKCLGSLSSS